MQIGFEEFFRGSEAPRLKPSRFNEVAQRILHRLIVINNRNYLGRSFRRHALMLASLRQLGQSRFRLKRPDFGRLNPYFRQRGDNFAKRRTYAGSVSVIRLPLTSSVIWLVTQLQE